MLPHIVIKIPYFTVFLYKIPLAPIPLWGVYGSALAANILRELVNYRHPSPRRLWREGLSCSSLRRSAGSGGVFQTSVSCTRNATFASGDPLPPSFVCLQDRNSYIVFSQNKNVYCWEKKSPCGRAQPEHSTFKRYFVCLHDKNSYIFFSKNKNVSF